MKIRCSVREHFGPSHSIRGENVNLKGIDTMIPPYYHAPDTWKECPMRGSRPATTRCYYVSRKPVSADHPSVQCGR